MKNSPLKKANIEMLILAIIVQLFFNVFANAYSVGNTLFGGLFRLPVELTIFLNILFSLLAIYLIVNIVALSHKEKELGILQKEIKHNENLATFLRELKHDLNNQFFVVNGLIQMGKVEQAANYSKGIDQQFQWMEALLELNQPEVAALILHKLMAAKNKDIIVEVTVNAKVAPKLSSEVFTRVVGNLLDNAIEALSAKKGNPRKLVIEINSNGKYLIFKVGNTGAIPEEISENMFTRGFSTKENKEGSGLGLHIVSSLIEGSGGSVAHRNEQGMVYFEVNIPVH